MRAGRLHRTGLQVSRAVATAIAIHSAVRSSPRVRGAVGYVRSAGRPRRGSSVDGAGQVTCEKSQNPPRSFCGTEPLQRSGNAQSRTLRRFGSTSPAATTTVGVSTVAPSPADARKRSCSSSLGDRFIPGENPRVTAMRTRSHRRQSVACVCDMLGAIAPSDREDLCRRIATRRAHRFKRPKRYRKRDTRTKAELDAIQSAAARGVQPGGGGGLLEWRFPSTTGSTPRAERSADTKPNPSLPNGSDRRARRAGPIAT